MKKNKVLFFISGLSGGAERMSITISKMLDPKVFDIKFVICWFERGQIESFIPTNCTVEFIKTKKRGDLLIGKLYKILKKEEPSHVFCSLIHLNIRLIIAAKLVGGIKIIVRNNNGLDVLKTYQKYLLRYTYKYADIIIAQQDEMRRELIEDGGLQPDKVVALMNPLDLKTINEKVKAVSPFPNASQTNYVWVGRIHYQKGHDILIKAFTEVLKEVDNAHLYIIGKYFEWESYYKDLLKLINNLGIEDRVHLIGFDDNPYRWIKYCDCFVLPSRVEGLPNALIEAMYLKRPVVATLCIPVISRIVKNGYNGITIPVEDPQALSTAMIHALTLKDFSMTYQPSNEEDYVRLFR